MASGSIDGVRIPIRWRDIDALGHVNNAVYLTYIEELLPLLIGPVLGDDYVTARVELDFRYEIRLGDREVTGAASIERIGTSSVTVAVALSRADGTVALEGRLVLVAWDPEQRRGRPLTEGSVRRSRRSAARSRKSLGRGTTSVQFRLMVSACVHAHFARFPADGRCCARSARRPGKARAPGRSTTSTSTRSRVGG